MLGGWWGGQHDTHLLGTGSAEKGRRRRRRHRHRRVLWSSAPSQSIDIVVAMAAVVVIIHRHLCDGIFVLKVWVVPDQANARLQETRQLNMGQGGCRNGKKSWEKSTSTTLCRGPPDCDKLHVRGEHAPETTIGGYTYAS